MNSTVFSSTAASACSTSQPSNSAAPMLFASGSESDSAGCRPRVASARVMFAQASSTAALRSPVPETISGWVAPLSAAAASLTKASIPVSMVAAGASGSIAWAIAKPTAAMRSGSVHSVRRATSSRRVVSLAAMNSGWRSPWPMTLIASDCQAKMRFCAASSTAF